MGADIPRKKGPALLKSDMLVINKIELAPHVEVDLDQMRADTAAGRRDLPFIFGSMRKGVGVDELVDFLVDAGGLQRR
jgi:urease accessory protein